MEEEVIPAIVGIEDKDGVVHPLDDITKAPATGSTEYASKNHSHTEIKNVFNPSDGEGEGCVDTDLGEPAGGVSIIAKNTSNQTRVSTFNTNTIPYLNRILNACLVQITYNSGWKISNKSSIAALFNSIANDATWPAIIEVSSQGLSQGGYTVFGDIAKEVGTDSWTLYLCIGSHCLSLTDQGPQGGSFSSEDFEQALTVTEIFQSEL